MCYSKEVQLTTGSIILTLSVFYYVHYSMQFHAMQKKWLIPFLKNVILAFVCIGGHQIFEFLSLQTGSEVIYKIGLIISLSSMYFFIRSLEVMLNRDLKSYLSLIIIIAVAIHAFSTEMFFEASSFHLRHNSVFIWAAAWMLLFIYFHICAINGIKYLRSKSSRKKIIRYLLFTLDISFILSVLYTLWGYWKHSINVCTDSPSIWCTFYVVQILFLPLFLSSASKTLKSPKKHTSKTTKLLLEHVIISMLILIILISLLPFFDCLSMKFVFP